MLQLLDKSKKQKDALFSIKTKFIWFNPHDVPMLKIIFTKSKLKSDENNPDFTEALLKYFEKNLWTAATVPKPKSVQNKSKISVF